MRTRWGGNPQQEAIALFKFLESRGFAPSVNSIGRALRDQGLQFRTSDLCDWLAEFRGKHPENEAGTSGKRNSSTPETVGKRSGNSRDVSSREKEVSLVEIASGTSYPQRSRSQPRLALVEPSEAAARAILDAVWPIVAARVGSVMTQKTWRARNKAVALDLARASVTPERVLAAHAELSRKAGEAIYMLSRVQDALVRERPAAVSIKPAGDDPVWLTEAFERGRQAQEVSA